MSKVVIRKHINLENVGEDYKGSLVFKAISVSQLAKIAEDKPETNIEAVKFILDILGKHFIEGEWEGEPIQESDLKDFDSDVVMYCFAVLTGQKPDPKA